MHSVLLGARESAQAKFASDEPHEEPQVSLGLQELTGEWDGILLVFCEHFVSVSVRLLGCLVRNATGNFGGVKGVE